MSFLPNIIYRFSAKGILRSQQGFYHRNGRSGFPFPMWWQKLQWNCPPAGRQWTLNKTQNSTCSCQGEHRQAGDWRSQRRREHWVAACFHSYPSKVSPHSRHTGQILHQPNTCNPFALGDTFEAMTPSGKQRGTPEGTSGRRGAPNFVCKLGLNLQVIFQYRCGADSKHLGWDLNSCVWDHGTPL